MVAKLKFVLFRILKEVHNFLNGTGISRKIPGVLMVYDFLFRHLWPHQNIIEIQGSKIYVNFRDKDPSMRKTFQAYALNRIHEEATTNLFKKVVKTGDIVVDLGANIGYFTLLAANLVGEAGKVYTFEPEPKNYNYLIRNIELNSYNNVFAIQKAVSNKVGKTKLYICPYDSGHHTINQYEGIGEYRPEFISPKKDFVEIETTTLDDFFAIRGEPADVIKMDIEGAEMLALSGMDKVIRKNKNLKIFTEFFPFLLRKMGSSPEEFIQRILEDYHFSIFVIGHEYSMSDYVSGEECLKINSVNELMNLCRGEKAHLNLFIKRGANIL